MTEINRDTVIQVRKVHRREAQSYRDDAQLSQDSLKALVARCDNAILTAEFLPRLEPAEHIGLCGSGQDVPRNNAGSTFGIGGILVVGIDRDFGVAVTIL